MLNKKLLLENALYAKSSKLNCWQLRYKYDTMFDSFFRNDTTDTELYTLKVPTKNKGTILYIVFRGTEPSELKDIFTDINAFAIPYGNEKTNIRIHKGVYLAYKSVRDFVHDKISDVSNVIVIGHSLAGGLAPVCAVDIQYNFEEKAKNEGKNFSLECYIYGALKAFNLPGVLSYNKRVPNTWNVQNKLDIVPHMPPVFGYKHVGNIYKITPNRLIGNHDIDTGYINYLLKGA
jgi:hypothetical protein